MPYIKEINKRVDLMINLLGIVNRTTGFPLYELTINFAQTRLRQHMASMNNVSQQFNELIKFVELFNEKQAKTMTVKFKELSKAEQEEYIRTAIEDRIYIGKTPMWEDTPIFYKIIEMYEKFDYMKPYDVYINRFGREIKIFQPQYIGEMYIMKLKQTSEKGFSARSTGSINSKGLPERSYKVKNNQELYSETPIRFGEFETLNFTIGIIPEDVAMFHLLYRTSVKARRDLTKHLLDPDGMAELDDSYDNRVAEIFDTIFKSLGIELRFVDEDNVLKEYDDKIIRAYEDGKEVHLCTEWEHYIETRRKSIEQEILNKFGVMDEEKLKEMVDSIIAEGKFLLG